MPGPRVFDGWAQRLRRLAAVILAVPAAFAEASQGGLTAEQFLRFAKSQESAIRDVAFAYEGETTYHGPADGTRAAIPFQGRYALRSDGATFMEIQREDEQAQPIHSIWAMARGRGERARVTPDFLEHPELSTVPIGSGPGAFFTGHSPETFQFLWRYQSLKGVADFGYRFLGWEEVDGHRCAHIDFQAHPGAASRVRQELWVDVERGAHPLRVRNTDGDQVVYLIDQIRLEPFGLATGEEVWFPVGGRYNEYFHRGQYTPDASYSTRIYVLNGMIFFNQKLNDGVFRVSRGEAFRPEFRRTAAPRTERPRRKAGVDFVDAEKDLDSALATVTPANRPPDATESARGEASTGGAVAWSLGLFGAGAVLIAGFLMWRSRTTGN